MSLFSRGFVVMVNHHFVGGVLELGYYRVLKNVKKSGNRRAVEAMNKALPFVVGLEGKDDMYDMQKAEELRHLALSMPFPEIWVESLDPVIRDDLLGFFCAEYGPKMYILKAFTVDSEYTISIGIEDTCISYRPLSVNGVDVDESIAPEADRGAKIFISIFYAFLNRIVHKDSQWGTSKQSKLIKGRITPFEITYVRSRRTKYTPSLREPQNVVWHHSWRVSGCWVRIRGVGKDREGKRTVKGMTWRMPHVKGSGALIEKIRVQIPEKVVVNLPQL